MMLPIAFYGNPILRKKAEPIQEITDDIRKLVSDMVETMDNNNGIGLAAPQVGKSIRLFVLRNYIELPNGQLTISAEPQVYINPKITFHSKETLIDVEGCLSIPGIHENVERPAKIIIEATDLNGQKFVEEIEGYNARVRMHENDHINGVLFVDRIPTEDYKKIESLLKDIKKQFHPEK
jgi:peptide deformylase